MNQLPSNNKQFSRVEILLRLLKFTAAMATFFGVVRIVQSGVNDITQIMNTNGFINLSFGLMSYLCAYLIEQKNNLAYMPMLIATLYPLSVSLTTGAGLNIIVIGFGVYVLYQIYQLHQEGYFGNQ